MTKRNGSASDQRDQGTSHVITASNGDLAFAGNSPNFNVGPGSPTRRANRLFRCASALIALALLPCLTVTTTAQDWNQWRGSSRDGLDTGSPSLLAKLPSEGVTPLWVAKQDLPTAKSGGWSSPVVADGRVYLFTHHKRRVGDADLGPQKYPYLPPEKRSGMSDAEYEEYEKNRRDEQEKRSKRFRFDEVTYCLEAATGKLVWKNEKQSVYTRFAQSGTPAVVQDRVFILGAGRIARCLNASTGETVWERKLPGEFRDQFLQSSFAVSGNTAAIVCGALFGLDRDSGEIRWTVGEPASDGNHSSPVAWDADGGPYFIANLKGGRTVGVRAENGEQVWEVESQGGNSTPLVIGDHLLTYGRSRKGGLRCFQLVAGKEPELKWAYRELSDPGSSPVVVDGYVYVQGERRLDCVRLEDGKARWTTSLDLDRPRYTSLVAADGKVIYAFGGILGFLADPEECTPWMNARINKQGLLGEEAMFRRQLDIERLEQTSEGEKEAQRLWRKEIGNGGPLPCASPAVADGRLYVRLSDGVACYDLRGK